MLRQEPAGGTIRAWRGMGDHRVASPIVCEGHSAGLDLRNRTGAKQRPRQSRRPSAAKRIIRAEVPKDTGSIYLPAIFFRATAARQHLDPLDLFARLLINGCVAEVYVPVQARVCGLGLRRGRWVREGSESELIEGVGHFLMLEKPAEINGRIPQFLGKA